MKRKSVCILLGVIVLSVMLGAAGGKPPKTPPKMKEETKFIEYMETSTYVASFDEISQNSDRAVRLKIMRQLDHDEVEQLNCIGSYQKEVYAYYEAEILEDYRNQDKNGETIILSQDCNFSYQQKGHPVYLPNDQFVMFLANVSVEENVWGAYLGRNSVFDVKNHLGEEYLYKRLGSAPIESEHMEIEESKVVTSYADNPAEYSQKIKLDDFVTYITAEINN